MLTSIQYEHLKSFSNPGADDRSTPRLRHMEKSEPEPRNCMQEYLNSSHDPVVTFDPAKTRSWAHEVEVQPAEFSPRDASDDIKKRSFGRKGRS